MNIHNYSFMKSVKWLSELKIRGSYGITGKANFPARTARTVYTMRNDFVYPTGVGVDMAEPEFEMGKNKNYRRGR